MSKLLINEPPLQVLPSLAKLVGLSEAIVLQQLHYESRKSKDDGWVQRAIVDWHRDDFPFLGRRTVVRAFTNLRGRGLILTELVTTDAGVETRMRVNMEALEALELPVKGSRQIGATPSRQSGATPSSQIGATGDANLAAPPTNKGTERTTTERTPIAPTGAGADSPDPVVEVFDAWRGSTGHLAAVLDAKRRRTIEKALALFPVADVVDAVRGWRHSPHHRGENDRRTVYDGIQVLLRDAEQIERMRDLERAHGGSDETGTCPAVLDAVLVQRWGDVVVPHLRGAVDESTFDVWLADVHPHGRDGDLLIVGAPRGKRPWIEDRFGNLLRAAVGRELRFVTCDADTNHGRAAA